MHKPVPLHPKKVKRWLLAASINQTFHRSCFIGHCTLYYLFIVLKCKCDPSLLSLYHCHLQQRAFCGRVVPLHCCVIWLHLHLHLNHPTSRRQSCQPPACPGGKSDLAAAEKSSCLLEQIQSSCKRGDRCDTL